MGHPVNTWIILPFALLLLTIALGPSLFPKWWLKNYGKIAFILGIIPVLYYGFALKAWHRVLEAGHEYASFVVLIGSLYVVSGGIHIHIKSTARPAANTLFLLIGAILANVLGTTGASMLLIRPWLRMNKHRISPHHVAFFIFIVSNIGGCLTPIGDPPLFLGFLQGIPFWWVAQHCWPMWLFGIGFLLCAFFVIDTISFRRASKASPGGSMESHEPSRFEGAWNIPLLGVILGAIFIDRPVFLRELMMAGAGIASLLVTRKKVREANEFNFHPIQEVMILFLGIFATMMPALDWLAQSSSHWGTPTPSFFYWGCGLLSSCLDNAPTYLSFLSILVGNLPHSEVTAWAQQTLQNPSLDLGQALVAATNQLTATNLSGAGALTSEIPLETVEQVRAALILVKPNLNKCLVATSIGAVFFGAASYIGNGPNFMVKSIADQQKIQTPGFVAYIFKYSLPILLPMFLLIWLLFFR